MTIGENIRKQRKAANLTQKSLGEKCNMPDSQIRQYELDKVTPRLEQLQRIADALNIKLSDLIDSKYIPELAINAIENIIQKIPDDADIEIIEFLSQLNDNGIQKAKELLYLLTKVPDYRNK